MATFRPQLNFKVVSTLFGKKIQPKMIHTPRGALCFGLLIIGAVLWPLQENWSSSPRDDFPLSYYPMFTKKRMPTHTLPYFVGYDEQGRAYHIPPSYIGEGGFNQVRRQLNKQVRKRKYHKVTRRVAARLARAGEAPYNRLRRVELKRGTYEYDSFFLSPYPRPLRERTLSSKTIRR